MSIVAFDISNPIKTCTTHCDDQVRMNLFIKQEKKKLLFFKPTVNLI